MRCSRKNIRLKTWDYQSASCYHVTFCVQGMSCILGSITAKTAGIPELDPRGESPTSDVRTALSDQGACIHDAIVQADSDYEGFSVKKFVVMPNHVHVLVAVETHGTNATLGRFVGYIKTRATRAAKLKGVAPVSWQRGYYEHIIRDENDYALTWRYIDENPAKWIEDEYFVE